MRSDRREITPDVTRLARPVPYEHEQLIAAFVGRGSVREVDANTFTPLGLSGSGPIALPAGAGPRTVIFYLQKSDTEMYGFYVQDDYRIRENVTLNLGLRWEYEGGLFDPEYRLPREVDLTVPVPGLQAASIRASRPM